MKKFYEKNELGFAIACIVVYVVGMSAADSLSADIGVQKLVTVAFCALLSALMLGFIRNQHLEEYYGLCKPRQGAERYLYYLPFVLLMSVGAWFGLRMNMPLVDTLCYVASMAFVGFLEEVIFRGFLFKAMCRKNVRSAIVVSSVTFGLGHIVNLLNGAELFETLMQICYAVAIGYLFTVFFLRTKSLIPCIVTHSVIDMVSTFSNEEMVHLYIAPISVAICVVAAGYALYIVKKVPAEDA